MRGETSAVDPIRCVVVSMNKQTTGGLAWIGSVVAKGPSHPVVAVSSHRL